MTKRKPRDKKPLTTTNREIIIDQLYISLDRKDIQQLQVQDIPSLLVRFMKMVEFMVSINNEGEPRLYSTSSLFKYEMTGEDKKYVVTRLIQRSIDDSNLTGSFEPTILAMIPSIIDMIVVADKGQLDLNPKITEGFSFLKSLCKDGCCTSCKK